MTHKQKILKALKSGQAITKLGALADYGCWNTGGRICELRGEGHNIITRMIKCDGKEYAEYKLQTS